MNRRISGSSMNPARSIGPAIINFNFNKLWIYIISPITGALVGASLYHFLQITKKPEAQDLHKNANCLDSGINGHDNPIYFGKIKFYFVRKIIMLNKYPRL
ncbi:hypothetical protein KSP39_PZI020340 [Platanthera zijinensis]|uniref:Aquaporin n=1 Tax=Platanthera zijinensis TaxID=2320716 RepID=A0AAP0FWT3_9ASPA